MEDRLDPGELKYEAIDIPWFHSHENVYMRVFQLRNSLNRIEECFEELERFYNLYESDSETIRRNQWMVALQAIRDLMESIEEVQWNFPELASEHWFDRFRSDVHHAYWRVEDGRFDNAYEDENELASLAGEVNRIQYSTAGYHPEEFYRRLNNHIEQMDWDLLSDSPPDAYEDEIWEAKDLFCLGYYSTALIVLGRAVEKALLELGKTREIESVYDFDKKIDWEDTKYYQKNEALRQMDMPGKQGKVFSKRQYHQISILIDYRNNVAHAEYGNIGREPAIRQLSDAGELLIELERKREYLEELDPEEIEPVGTQNIQH